MCVFSCMLNKNLMNNRIFNSSSNINDYFVFSLDNSKIFYSDKEKGSIIPNFSIIYDNNRQCFYGNETNNNITNNLDKSYQTVNPQTQNNINNRFKLSGKSQFNILCFEIYEVIIENN